MLTERQSYVEIGKQFVQLASALQMGTIDFGSKVFKKQNQCRKGYACGYSCIAKERACKSPLTGQAKDYAGWLKIQIQAGAKLSDRQSKDAQSLGLTKRTVSEAQNWYKASLANAPADVQKLIERIDDPYADITGIKKGQAAAFYRPTAQSINMGKFKLNTDLGQAVYRHELGHHVDAQLGQMRKTELIKRALKDKAGVNTLDELEALQAKDPTAYAAGVKGVAMAVGLGSFANIGDIRKSQAGDPPSYISSSKVAATAYAEDEKKLLEWAKKTDSAYLDLAKTDLAKYRAQDPKLDGMMKGRTLDQLGKREQIDVGVRIMINKVHRAIAQRAAKLGLDPKDDATYAEVAKQEFANDTTIFGAMYREVERQGWMTDNPRKEATMLFTMRGTRDPEMMAQYIDGVRSGSNVQDLVGSITKNKVSQGHADSYYSGAGGATKQRTEILANTFDLHASGNELDRLTVQTFSPDGHKLLKGLINAANTGKI